MKKDKAVKELDDVFRRQMYQNKLKRLRDHTAEIIGIENLDGVEKYL